MLLIRWWSTSSAPSSEGSQGAAEFVKTNALVPAGNGAARRQGDERVDGDRANLRDGFWEIENAVVTRIGQPSEKFSTYLVSTYLSPERVRDALGTAISVSFWELPAIIEEEIVRLRDAGLLDDEQFADEKFDELMAQHEREGDSALDKE